MEDEDDNISDSTVLLDDYQYNPDKIAAKRRKLAANYGAGAPVTSENAAPDDENDTINTQPVNANSSPLGENNGAEYHHWRVNKYFNSIDDVRKANEDVYNEDLKIKRELLKEETCSNQTEDIKGQDLSNHIEGDSNEEDVGVIVIEDSDDDSVADEAKDKNDPNSQASSDVFPGPHCDQFSKGSRIRPQPSAINARRATINNFGNNDAAWNSTNIQDNQPRLRILQPAAINARRATIDISELKENIRIETVINNRNNTETENLTENMTVNQMEPGFNEPPVVNEISNATNEVNTEIKNSQSNDETRLKHTHATNCDNLKTHTITDSFVVDKGVEGVIPNPELTSARQNNINDFTQITPHKNIEESGKKDKKKQINFDKNSSLIATYNEFSCNKGIDSVAQLTRGSVSDSSCKDTNPREEVLNIYVNANDISRKRLSIDITLEDKSKRSRNSIDQSNNTENMKNTESNHTPESKDVNMETNDGQVFDAPNENESDNKANNQSVTNTNDEGNKKESLMYGEMERVIKFQVGFCTLLKGNLQEYCQIHSKDSEKVDAYLKSAESLTNEIESLKALAYDRRVKADIQYACPICTRVSTYSASLLYSNVEIHRNVETNGGKCKFCRRIGSLYNSYMNKYLQKGNNKTNNGSKVESNINNAEIPQKNNQIPRTSSNTYDDANNRDANKPIQPVEKMPGRESRKHSEESNNIVDCVPEADKLDTCVEKDTLEHNNNFNLEGVTPSETIVESNKLLESRANIHSNQGTISVSAEINTSVEILEVVSPKERAGLNVSKDNIEDSNSADNSRNSGIGIVSRIDEPHHVSKRKVTNNVQDTAEKEANNTIEKSPYEVTLPNIVSTTINNDNEDHGVEMAYNVDSETAHRHSEEAHTFQSTTIVDTPNVVTTDELPNVLRNTSNNSERNASRCTESLVSVDDYVISKFFCKKNKDVTKIGSSNLKQNHKRKINNYEFIVFKRIRPDVAAENKDDKETSAHKDDVSGQNSSNNPVDGDESNTCGKQKTSPKHTDVNGQNIGDRRSYSENIGDNFKPNDNLKGKKSSKERELARELSRIETTETQTTEQNINHASNKSSDNIGQIVEDNEKPSPSNDKARENFDTSKTNKSNEVSKNPNSDNRDNQRLPNNHKLNDTEHDADTEDHTIGVADKMSDVDTINRQERGVNKKGEPINNIHKEVESSKQNEKSNTTEDLNVSDNRKQDANDESRRINEKSHEDGSESETADTDVEGNANSTDERDTNGDEPNNTIRKTLQETFEKIKRNLNMTAPPSPHAANSNNKPRKILENKVFNQNKLDIKCQTQYVCNICTCVFIYGGRFLHHMIENHNMDLTKIPKQCVIRKCSFCHVFLQENTINIHVKKYHSDKYLRDGDAGVVEQDNEVKNGRKNRLIKKDEKWKYICLICNVTINSDYSARKHRKDKHPDMKNKTLYDKVSVDEINKSSNEEANKTNRSDWELKKTKKDAGEIVRSGEHDSNESCSEDGSSEHETEEENDKDHEENGNSKDSCDKDNDQASSGSSSEDEVEGSGDDSDAECDKSGGSSPPIIEKDQEDTQKSDELSGDEDRGTTNENNSDRRSSSDEDMEYNTNHSSEDASCDEGEINRRDVKEQNVTHQEGTSDAKKSKESTRSDESDNDCSDDEEDAECGKDGITGINHREGSYRRTQLRVNELNAPRKNKKHAAIKIPKVKYYFECILCELTLNSLYAVHKHRKEKHPNLKHKRFIAKKYVSEYGKPNIEKKGDHFNYENEQSTRDEDGSDFNSCSDTNHTDEDYSNSEYDGNEICSEKKSKVVQQNNEVQDGRKNRLIEKYDKWRFICLICNVTIKSDYSARKHRKEKHPDMKNRTLYDKVFVEEINKSSNDEANKTNRFDCDPKQTKKEAGENFRASDHDSNESCSEDGSSEHETDEENDKDHEENGNGKDSCDKENDQASSGSSSEDEVESSGDDSDVECDQSGGSSPPIINQDQEDTQKSDELSGGDDRGTTNEDNSDRRSSSDEDMEYNTNHSSEEASCDEREINRRDVKERNVTHQEGTNGAKKSKDSTRSDESENDCSDDEEDTECGKDGTTRINHREGSYKRTKLRVNELNAPGKNKKHAAIKIPKVKYYYECILCELTLNSLYAVHKHRKEKHPNLKYKRFIAKKYVSEYGKPNIEKKGDHFNYENEQPTRDEDGSDFNSCSDIDHTDEDNNDSEYDGNEISGEGRNVVVESGQRREDISSEEDVDENSDSEPEASKNYDSSDANNEENDEQDILSKDGNESGTQKNKCDAMDNTGTINEENHENASNNLQSGNVSRKSKKSKILSYTYECTACEVTLDSGYAVRKHRKDIHPDEKNKRLIRKTLSIVDEALQETSDDNMRKDKNVRQDTGNEHISSDNMDYRNDVNTSRRDEITEQRYDSTHKINGKTKNPTFNNHIEDNLKNDRSDDHPTDKSTANATAEPPSDHETFMGDQMRLNESIDKNFDQDKNTMNSIENKKNPSAHNNSKCILCNQYFQSAYFMRIHREREHPLMNNVKIFEKVVKNCAREENSRKNVECRVEWASKTNNATEEESQNNITEISTVQKLTNAGDDSGGKDSRKNLVTNATVKTDVNEHNFVENGKGRAYGRMNQNSTDNKNTDKSTCKKDSSPSGGRKNVFQTNKKANKHDQEHIENSSDVRKARFSNCHVCAINFDVNEQIDHVCTLRKENDVFYNCHACGMNFLNNMEHLCSKKHETWIDNIQISNVVTIKDSYIFSCIECKYSTYIYDDAVKHCQNHYLEIVDAVTYCGICQLNFDEHLYSTHHSLHAKFDVVKYSYTSLFCNWDAIFDDIPTDVATELKARSIYTTRSIRMVTVEDGPHEYSLYQCDQCKSCVPKHDLEKHCLSRCSEMNYVCSVCDRAFMSYEMCVNHEVTHRNGAKIFRVIAFNRKEDRKNDLKLIESRELKKKDIKPKAPTAELFQCQCDLIFVSMANFKLHFLECDSTSRNGISCPKCAVKRIFLEDELGRHSQLHHGEIIYEFVLNQINIRRSIQPNELKCEFKTTEQNEAASSELDADEIKLKRELLKQEDDTIIILDDDD